MANRLELHDILLAMTPKVYFQPPENHQMEYPCIVYERDSEDTLFADNVPFRRTKRYSVTVIDRDPDSAIPDKVASLPMSSFDRHFTADDLNHDVFTIFF
jgi:hypothetical protein